MNASVTTFAADNSVDEGTSVAYSIEIEDDSALDNATIVSSNSYIEDGRQNTVIIYEKEDGTIITDTLSVSAIATYSKNGSTQQLEQE